MRLVVGGWFYGKRAGRGAIRERKGPALFERRQVAKRGMRLAGIDMMLGNVVLIGPFQDGPAGELRSLSLTMQVGSP